MKVKLQGNKIAVESVNKVKKHGFMEMPESDDNTGRIKFIGQDYDGNFKLGQVVCYGDQRQNIKLDGNDLQIMEPDNIFAILEETNEVKEDHSKTN